MQTTRNTQSDEGTLPRDPERATGIFTGPDGIAGLYYRRRRFAYVDHARDAALAFPEAWFKTKVQGGSLKWRCWEMKRLYWSHSSSLLVLQGANLQHLFRDRFVLLKGRHVPVTDPRPGMVDVHLAEVDEAPPGFTVQDVFFTVVEEALQGKPVSRA